MHAAAERQCARPRRRGPAWWIHYLPVPRSHQATTPAYRLADECVRGARAHPLRRRALRLAEASRRGARSARAPQPELLDEAVAFAEASPLPGPEELLTCVYVGRTLDPSLPGEGREGQG